ncbi:MAG: signal peptidase I [Muribaculaceae bacterium]|nr:signal peptidase I [Muribaculaceae bacterium]
MIRFPEISKFIKDLVEYVYLTLFFIMLCIASWYLMRIFLFDQFITPTESMEPTLLPGDRIIVDKTISGARIYSDFNFDKNGIELKSWRTRGRRAIKPNDILVFNYPRHDDKINFVINNVYAKRCIGVPGDSVSIANGHFRNNNYKGLIGLKGMQDSFENIPDSVFPEFAFHCLPYDGHLPWTIKNFGPLYLPRKGDHVKLTAKEGSLYRMLLEWETRKNITFDWETDRVFADGNTLDFHTFRHSYYFMCGDNVINSNDSRYWGLVPEEYIVGVVSRISYSIDPKTGKYRKDRIFKKML